MKIFLSVLKALLSLWVIMGAVYMMGHYEDLASPEVLRVLPGVFWLLLGVVQIVLALILIISIWNGRLRTVSSPAALVMAGITLSGSVLYTAYTGFPGILCALVPAALFTFISYKK